MIGVTVLLTRWLHAVVLSHLAEATRASHELRPWSVYGLMGHDGRAGRIRTTMIVWINGAFGAGKTTLAEELHRRLPDALLFDPEYVGAILVKWAPPAPSGDFQDIPLWRKLVADFAIGLAAEYGRTLIVPMTLVDTMYRDEIFGLITDAGQPLLHVFLDVPAVELRRRIDAQILVDDPAADAQARAFRHSNIDRCVAARDGLPPETLLLRGDQHTPAELADLVMAAEAFSVPAGHR